MRARERSVYLPLAAGNHAAAARGLRSGRSNTGHGTAAGHHGSRPGALSSELPVRSTAGARAGRAAPRPGDDGRRPHSGSLPSGAGPFAEGRRRRAEPGVPGGVRDGPGRAGRRGPRRSRRSHSPPSRSHAAKPKPRPENPDEVDQTGEPIVEPIVRASDARTEAWLALAQALFGTAEFRYVR